MDFKAICAKCGNPYGMHSVKGDFCLNGTNSGWIWSKETFQPLNPPQKLPNIETAKPAPVKAPQCGCGGRKAGYADYSPGHPDYCAVAPNKAVKPFQFIKG